MVSVSRNTFDRFYLTVKVISKRITFEDLQSRGKRSNQEANIIMLVPEDSTEADLFLNAWLPDQYSEEQLKETHGVKDWSEVVFECGRPVFGFFRGALRRADKLSTRPYIFVMTKSAEEALELFVGKKIQLTAIGEGEEGRQEGRKEERRNKN